MLGGINLNPNSNYIKRHKNGKVNLSNSIRSVVSDMRNGETFTSSSMVNFLSNCGLENPGRAGRSLYSLSKRDTTIEAQPIKAYYRVNKPK